MKRVICSIVMMLTCMAPALADLKLPRHSFRVASLADAQKEAKEKNRPLLFLYSTTEVT
ncbi:MAG: hypothetical protein JXR37_04320 [Kiritimatiellae bacterium]|nr:hypothetical protein [Kiritimatiellia bacterium]